MSKLFYGRKNKNILHYYCSQNMLIVPLLMTVLAKNLLYETQFFFIIQFNSTKFNKSSVSTFIVLNIRSIGRYKLKNKIVF